MGYGVISMCCGELGVIAEPQQNRTQNNAITYKNEMTFNGLDCVCIWGTVGVRSSPPTYMGYGLISMCRGE